MAEQMSLAERLAHALWTAESEPKDAVVNGDRRKAVWHQLVSEIRKLDEAAKRADALAATMVAR
jgi:hypothetical protein